VAAATESDPLVVDLIAGQNKIAGSIQTWDDGQSLFIRFQTTGSWCLTESHLAVALSLDEIPQSNGNPIPGQFPYKNYHQCATNFLYTIPLENQACELYIAAHASVKKPGAQETAWANGNDFPGNNWATYFIYQTNDCNTNSSSPTITDIFPNAGPVTGGTVVVITGTNLTDTLIVTFGDEPTTTACVVDSDTQITCIAPPQNAGPVDVSVTTSGGTTTAPDGYIYSPQNLPDGWEGSVVVESNRNILTVARPYFGTQIASYDGYSTGSTTNYLPMLFKQAFGGSYNSAFYLQNIDPTNSTNFTIQFYDTTGSLSCALNDTLPRFSSRSYKVSDLGCLASGWVGGAIISSDHELVAVGHPQIGAQQMTYNSFFHGSTSVYVPMLFNQAFGGTYVSALYIQNLDPNFTATFSLKFYDTNGNLTCTMLNQQRDPLAAKGYWLPTETCVPPGWVGGVLIESDHPLAAVARSHVGAEITAYSGVVESAHTTYVPMLFKNAFGGGYDAALYVQNADLNNAAQITINYYASSGALTCTTTETFAPMAAKGYWLPAIGCITDGWAGSAVIISDSNVVAVGRPHIGAEVTSYNGLSFGGHTAYLPMLFKNGGLNNDYNSALYVQNLESEPAEVNIKFFDATGELSCVINETYEATAVKGYWLPSLAICP